MDTVHQKIKDAETPLNDLTKKKPKTKNMMNIINLGQQ